MAVPAKPTYVRTVTAVEWENLPLRERWLHVMRSQMGVREYPSNWGAMVKLYLKVAGIFTPAPWCLALVTWALVEAGVPRSRLPKLAASSYFWWKWAREENRLLSSPKRGDVGLWNEDSGGHGFAIRSVDGKFVGTLEGNTNSKGAREGVEAAERTRSIASIRDHKRWGFVNVEGLDR